MKRIENPLDPRPAYGALGLRWACLLLLASAMAGPRILVWISLPVLCLVFVLIWGKGVLFSRSLEQHPWLAPGSREGEAIGQPPMVAIVSTARNEAVGIEAAVRSLAALEYPAFEILVVDDHSTDATPAILRRLASELPRLRVLDAPSLDAGWVGKNGAAWFGVRNTPPSAEWLLFVDARVTFHAQALRRAVGFSQRTGLDFLSCVFLSQYGSLAEELLGPLQIRAMVEALPGQTRAAGRPPVGIGAFMLVRREIYEGFGGHAANPGNAIDDTMLAVGVESHGGKCGLAFAPGLLQLRRYHGYRDLRGRVVRAMRLSSSDTLSIQANSIAMDLLLYVAPALFVPWGLGSQLAAGSFDFALSAQALLGGLGYLAGVAAFDRSRSLCAFRKWISWCHPVGVLLRVWLRLLAVTEKVLGQEVSWRGRAVAVPQIKH